MKKLLSIILAAAMLLSLVPSVLAVVDEETGLNELTYSFNRAVFGETKTFEFTTGSTGFSTVDGANTAPYSVLRWTPPNSSGTTYFDANCYRFTAAANSSGALLLEINIDKEGTYKPSVNFSRADRGGYLELYLIKDTSKLTNGISATAQDTKLFADVTNNYTRLDDIAIDTATSATDSYTYYEYANTVEFDEAGKYYLAVVLNGANATAEKLKAGKAMIYVNSVILREIEVEEPEPTSEAIVYGFDAESTGNGSSSGKGVTMASGDYTKSESGGYWEHISDNLKNAAIYGTFAKWTTKDGHNVSPENPAYLTLKINVDKAGTYTPSVNCQYRTRGGQLKIYLTKTASFEAAYNSETPLDNKYIETYSATSDEFTDHFFQNVTLDAGTYYLHFVVDGIDTNATDTAQEHIKNFTLTPVADAPSDNITYCVASNHPDDKMQVKTSARGNTISLSAAEKEGYTFRAWVRGSADNGTWISADPEYSFIAMTNTMLTAVYTKNNESGDDKVVEYYNENGAYIATQPTSEAAPTPEKLVGYTFDAWYVNDQTKLDLESIAEALTRAVAKHNVEDTTYTVTYNGGSDEYKYNDEITLTASEAVCWYRDGKAVDYGTTYTFFVWDDTTVTTASGNNEPKVMLDKAKSSSRMIEYDEGNGDIIEAGIIFGDSASITVDSCSEKMISQKNSAHGQFTATSDYSVARGYIIYKNVNGGLAIAYAD